MQEPSLKIHSGLKEFCHSSQRSPHNGLVPCRNETLEVVTLLSVLERKCVAVYIMSKLLGVWCSFYFLNER